MGFVLIGIGSFSSLGTSGAMLQMVSHGLIGASLFFLVGATYDRTKTLKLDEMSGVGQKMSDRLILELKSKFKKEILFLEEKSKDELKIKDPEINKMMEDLQFVCLGMSMGNQSNCYALIVSEKILIITTIQLEKMTCIQLMRLAFLIQSVGPLNNLETICQI